MNFTIQRSASCVRSLYNLDNACLMQFTYLGPCACLSSEQTLILTTYVYDSEGGDCTLYPVCLLSLVPLPYLIAFSLVATKEDASHDI